MYSRMAHLFVIPKKVSPWPNLRLSTHAICVGETIRRTRPSRQRCLFTTSAARSPERV